jgi:hypothetical protein
MKTAYVVRELVSRPTGENEFFTHYEYGTFRTYKEANEFAITTKNPRCFPQREQFIVPTRSTPSLTSTFLEMHPGAVVQAIALKTPGR